MTALAHKAAIEAVTKLDGELLVKAYSKGRLSEVKDEVRHFKFYAAHLSYEYMHGMYSNPDYISFDVEQKFYLTSNHCTKISFYSPEHYIENRTYEFGVDEVDHEKTDAEKKRRQKKILAFIEKIMADANIKPVPRFSLKQMQA